MLPEQRKRKLLDLLQQNGAADVGHLAEVLDVSPATVRRDLQMLAEHGHVRRTHGGAVLPHVSTAFEPPYTEKSERNAEQKAAIAREASRRVAPGEVVVLDSGSTTLALARELKHLHDLTVITSDLKIALELGEVPSTTVIIVGGTVRTSLYSVIGPFAERMLQDLHSNHSFLGADAVSLQAGLTNATLEEVPIKRLMLRCGNRSVLLADSSKFGKASLAKIADLSEFDEVVTDCGISGSTTKAYADAGIQLTCAE